MLRQVRASGLWEQLQQHPMPPGSELCSAAGTAVV